MPGEEETLYLAPPVMEDHTTPHLRMRLPPPLNTTGRREDWQEDLLSLLRLSIIATLHFSATLLLPLRAAAALSPAHALPSTPYLHQPSTTPSCLPALTSLSPPPPMSPATPLCMPQHPGLCHASLPHYAQRHCAASTGLTIDLAGFLLAALNTTYRCYNIPRLPWAATTSRCAAPLGSRGPCSSGRCHNSYLQCTRSKWRHCLRLRMRRADGRLSGAPTALPHLHTFATLLVALYALGAGNGAGRCSAGILHGHGRGRDSLKC